METQRRKYLTIVFDVTDWSREQIGELVCKEEARYLGWGHIPHKFDEFKREVEHREASLKNESN